MKGCLWEYYSKLYSMKKRIPRTREILGVSDFFRYIWQLTPQYNHKQDYQDPSRLPTVSHHGWPSAGEESKCLKIPPHIPQVMIKLPLKCMHSLTLPQPHHHPTHSTPRTHPIHKLEPPNIQPVPSPKQLEAMPFSTIVSHKLFRIHILKASKNLEDLRRCANRHERKCKIW